MLFSTGIEFLSRILTKTPTDKETEDKIKQALNVAKVEIGKAAFWQQLLVPNNELLIIPKYTTGKASITKDNRVVTLTDGAVVIDGFKGRFFSSPKTERGYEIADVNTVANTLTLKTPIIEDTEAGIEFSIRKKFYRLPSDILAVLPDNSRSDGNPGIEIEGYDEYQENYTTGTITLTKDSATFTGTGTAFFDNVFSGDIIEAGANVYRVKRVKSDTVGIMLNRAIDNFSGTYVIRSDTPYKGKLKGVAIHGDQTEKSIFKFSYIRSLYYMVHPNDDTEFPTQFDLAILDFAKGEFGRMAGTGQGASWQQDLGLADARLRKLMLDRKLVYEPFTQFKMYIPAGMGRG